MTLFETFIKYIRYELNLSTHTVLSYSSDLSQFVTFLSGGDCTATLAHNSIDARRITTGDVRAWMASLSAAGLSLRSVHRKLQALRAFFKYAMKTGVIEENPCDSVELAKAKMPLPQYVRPDAMDEVLSEEIDGENFEEVRDSLIVEMLYDTGIRRSELVGLKDSDVSTARGELKVLGKRNKERIVPFAPVLAEKIELYRRLRNREVGDSDVFFVRCNGEPLYPGLVYRVVKNALASTGLEKRSPHVLRHSFASAMLNDGAEINSVKELLGHQNLSATQIYTHITISELKHDYQQAHPRATKKGG